MAGTVELCCHGDRVNWWQVPNIECLYMRMGTVGFAHLIHINRGRMDNPAITVFVNGCEAEASEGGTVLMITRLPREDLPSR